MMLRATVYHWYEAFEKGRASASLKGGPCAPCRAVTEVIVNTAATIIQQEPTLMLTAGWYYQYFGRKHAYNFSEEIKLLARLREVGTSIAHKHDEGGARTHLRLLERGSMMLSP